jgi:hypothetical protein
MSYPPQETRWPSVADRRIRVLSPHPLNADSDRKAPAVQELTSIDATAEVWGRCGPCERWFYCGHSGRVAVLEACPVCAAPPSRLEHRL